VRDELPDLGLGAANEFTGWWRCLSGMNGPEYDMQIGRQCQVMTIGMMGKPNMTTEMNSYILG
jgi:hypothetical protein